MSDLALRRLRPPMTTKANPCGVGPPTPACDSLEAALWRSKPPLFFAEWLCETKLFELSATPLLSLYLARGEG